MKVALVHDWLTGMRGGERVLERLCAMFPGAPIYTLLWNRGTVSPAIEAHPIRVSFVQRLPGAARNYRWYLPLFPRAIEGLVPRGFDVVVSSSHCAAKAVPVPEGTFHLSYVYTPMRYVWELEDQYFPPGRFPWPVSWYVRRACARLRAWDRTTSRRPDALVAISAHVARRIARHYGREAEIVHPPVELERFAVGTGPRDYYLVAGALAPYKRADLAIRACGRLGRPLRVAGTGQEERRIRRLAHPGVEFLGAVSDAEMARLYQEARALIFPGEEDFGIVPLEAMASGCPVIALGRGGALETVARNAPGAALEQLGGAGVAAVPGGVLFAEQTVDGVCGAIRAFEALAFDPRAVRAVAEPFGAERFDREFLALLHARLAGWRNGRSARRGDLRPAGRAPGPSQPPGAPSER